MTSADDLTCQDLVELITDYLEGVLPDDIRARFEGHLEGCLGCRTYVDQMRQTIRALGTVSEEESSLKTKEDLLRLFREWKQPRDQAASEE
jgi:anti-sigma factor RsiW